MTKRQSAPNHDSRRRVSGRLALLQVAEKLYGQYGLDGVTIRQVVLASGSANNSAVAYHFGNKDGLLRAVCEWRLPMIEAAATAEWARVRAEGLDGDIEALIGVLLRPFLAICDSDGRHPHARFMQQMLRSSEGRAIRIALLSASPATAAAFDLLRQRLSHLPRELLNYRMRIGSVAFFDGITEWDCGKADGDFPAFSKEQVVSELIGMVAANCRRPIS